MNSQPAPYSNRRQIPSIDINRTSQEAAATAAAPTTAPPIAKSKLEHILMEKKAEEIKLEEELTRLNAEMKNIQEKLFRNQTEQDLLEKILK